MEIFAHRVDETLLTIDDERGLFRAYFVHLSINILFPHVHTFHYSSFFF